MASSVAYSSLPGSTHPHPPEHKKLHPTDGSEELTVTLLLRRKGGPKKLKPSAMLTTRDWTSHSRSRIQSGKGELPGTSAVRPGLRTSICSIAQTTI